MGKKTKGRQWRYLKLPAMLDLTVGEWHYTRGPDRTITDRFASGGAKVVTQSPPGTGATVSYYSGDLVGGLNGPTISLDHVQDERTGRWMLHLMVNMERFRREPSWEEWKAIREVFFPADVDTAIILPALENYVNVSEWVFHLWQLPEVWSVPTWGLVRQTLQAKKLLARAIAQQAMEDVLA